MKPSKCLLCQKKFRKPPSLISSEELGCDFNHEVGECRTVNEQVHVIFLLRKVLEIPEETCCKLLQHYGNPNVWIRCCPLCSIMVEKAKRTFEQLKFIKHNYEELQKKIKRAIGSSNGDPDESDCEVQNFVRSYINKGFGNSPPTPQNHFILKEEKDSKVSIIDSNNQCESLFTTTDNPECDQFSKNVYQESNVPCFTSSEVELASCIEEDNEEDPLKIDEMTGSIDSSHGPTSDFTSVLQNSELSLESAEEQQAVDHKLLNVEESFTVKEVNQDYVRECEREDSLSCSSTVELINTQSLRSNPNKRHKCSVCGRPFSTQCMVKRHMRIHTGERPYECTYCDKTFVQSGNLKKHLRVHTGEKPFCCKICKKCFAQSGSLKGHLRTHLNSVTGKPYQCFVCNCQFFNNTSLRQHIQIHMTD